MSEERKHGFWTSLPGILTGLAAVLGAATGLYIAIHKDAPVVANEPAPSPTAAAPTQASPPLSQAATDAQQSLTSTGAAPGVQPSPSMTELDPDVTRLSSPRDSIAPSIQANYHAIVASSANREEAIARAKELRANGYASEVIRSTSGAFGVSLGRYASPRKASAAIELARRRGDAPGDAYVLPPERWDATVFP